MKSMIMNGAAAAALVAVTAFAATPSEARWSNGSAAAAGFVGGALVGAAVANSYNNNAYYGSGYGYGYAPGYAYGGPGYYDSYAYEPAPAYYGSRTYYRGNNSTRGYANDSMSNSRAPNE